VRSAAICVMSPETSRLPGKASDDVQRERAMTARNSADVVFIMESVVLRRGAGRRREEKMNLMTEKKL